MAVDNFDFIDLLEHINFHLIITLQSARSGRRGIGSGAGGNAPAVAAVICVQRACCVNRDIILVYYAAHGPGASAQHAGEEHDRQGDGYGEAEVKQKLNGAVSITNARGTHKAPTAIACANYSASTNNCSQGAACYQESISAFISNSFSTKTNVNHKSN